ncbi:MAG: glutaredoxin family protein [candidate division Zixibacteria bacterium]|nr:glutaredoxin family protein [candidate division Zixibacteria bacterium]
MFCNKTKEFLSRNNISYAERNVAEDESALEELKQMGHMTTPVIVIDGTQIVGFNEAELIKQLGL